MFFQLLCVQLWQQEKLHQQKAQAHSLTRVTPALCDIQLLKQLPMPTSSKNSLPLCILLCAEAVSFFSVLNHPLGFSVVGFDELWLHFKLGLLFIAFGYVSLISFSPRLIAPTFIVSFESFFISTDILIALFFPFSVSSMLSWRQDARPAFSAQNALNFLIRIIFQHFDGHAE